MAGNSSSHATYLGHATSLVWFNPRRLKAPKGYEMNSRATDLSSLLFSVGLNVITLRMGPGLMK